MVITLACPACGVALRVAAERAGQQGKCPKCRAPLTVPRVSPAASAATASSENPPSTQLRAPAPKRATEPPPQAERDIATIVDRSALAKEVLGGLSGVIEPVPSSL